MTHEESQEKMILKYLQAGNTITPLEALDRFGSFRLASRISNLNKRLKPHPDAENPIKVKMVAGDNGKRWARYWLPKVGELFAGAR